MNETLIDIHEEQITTFKEESNVQLGNPHIAKKRPDLKWIRDISTYQESRFHNLLDFLKRPRPIMAVPWTALQTTGTVLASFDLPMAMLSSPMITCKTNDFAFFRCDFKFRFQLNVNKFAIGCLLVNSHPVPTLSDSLADDLSLTAATCTPYGLIDASSGATVEFSVPFTYNNAAWDMVNDQAVPWNTVILQVLNQLVVTQGSSVVEVRVWLWAENISLEVPVPNRIEPFAPAKYVAHMNTESSKAATSGSIVGVAKKVAGAAKDFGEIGSDILDGLGAAANWFTDLGGAEMLGFSKPSNMSSKVDVTQTPAKGMSSFNGDDNSVMLSANVKNSLTNNNELFGVSTDQMDISYIVSNPCYLETFIWSTLDASNKVLQSWPVCPGLCAPASATTSVRPGHMAYTASMFSLWRGDICFKFQVVANSFYSGRLGIVFYPRKGTVPVDVTLDDVDGAVQAIIDVRDSSVVEYTARWAVNKPWLQVRVASRTSDVANMRYTNLTNVEFCSGILAMYVVTPLVAPESVPTSIYINVFTYGDKSLQFANPACENYVPIYEAAPGVVGAKYPWLKPDKVAIVKHLTQKKDAQSKSKKNKIHKYKAQMDNTPATMQSDPGVKGAHIMPIKGLATGKDHEISAATVGEVIQNLRQLTRCFSEVGNFDITAGDNDWLTLDPAYFGWDQQTVFNPRYWRISRIYTFWRGSVRWKLVPRIPSTVTYPVLLVQTDYFSNPVAQPPNVGIFTQNGTGYPWFVNVQTTPVIEVSTPFYSRNLLSTVSETNCNARQRILITQDFGVTVPTIVYAATGDDFSFGFLKAPPELQLYEE